MPSESAFSVTELLEQHFEEIVNSNFTAGMEEELDKVEKNEIDWQVLLKNFYDPFMAKIAKGKTDIKSQKVIIPLDRNCPTCGEVLVQRAGRFGDFISCSTYPKCKYSENIGKDKEPPKPSGVICDKCGGEMVIKSSFRGEFLACSNYPECKNTKPLREPESSKVPCPKCGAKLLKRISKRGAFFGCANYPKCDFVSKYEPTDIKCEECGGVTVLKELKTKKELECLSCKHKSPVA
jgi:DNA topoisomerase-1